MFSKTNRPLKVTAMLALAALMVTLLAACGNSAAPPPPPTRTPAPTFTPTVAAEAQPIDPGALATAQAAAQQPVVEVPPAAAPSGGDTGTQPVTGTTAMGGGGDTQPPAAEPTVAPTNTPEAKPQVSTTQQVNVRQGPSTNYAVIGLIDAGQTYDITGKNNAGDWWQITYNGAPGWVLGQLVTSSNAGSVAVAQNIPAEPTPAPVVQAPPTNTPVPAPAEPVAPAPTQPPASNYQFNVAVVGRCDPQAAGTWFEGKTYINGVPQSGYRVVWSGAGPDGEWATEPMPSGPHQGYEGWDQGYYSHLVSARGPIAGTWSVWIVDETGKRISDIAQWTSSGNVAEGTGCNQAIVDFDSR
jgi:uncharacterized protein YraI